MMWAGQVVFWAITWRSVTLATRMAVAVTILGGRVGNFGHRWGRVGAFVGLSLWLVIGSGATPVFAEGDLRYQSNAVYTVDAAGVVHVAFDLTLTNTKSDSGLTYYYFDTVTLAVTANAANVQATRNGKPLSVSIKSQNRFYSQAEVRLSPTLRSRQTQVVRVTYDIPPSGARVPGVNRINPAYMTFVAFAFGDPSLTTVSVRVPDNFDVDVTWEDMDQTFESGVNVYTAANIENPDEWAASVTASDEDALTVDRLTVAGHDISIRSWPDDPQWGKFVADQLTKGIPALEELIGSKLPTSRTLQVTETATPYIYGYAGWYQPSDNTIEIGDVLDSLVILHETAHAWFNRKEFDDRWVSEGFAEDFASRAVQRSGGTQDEPTKPDLKSEGTVTLNEWSDPDFDGADSESVEEFGYNASFYVMRTISNEIGPKKMAAAVQSAFEDEAAYGVRGVADELTEPFDWRNMLDAFELVGGSKTAPRLFRDYVVADFQRDALEDRTAALKAYRKLEELGGSWAAPAIIRERMADWSFTSEKSPVGTANKVLAERDRVNLKLKALKSDLPKSFQKSYEDAGNGELDGVLKTLQAYGRAVDSVIAAKAATNADRSVWQSIGLFGADTDQPILDAVSALERNESSLAITYSQRSVDQIDDAARIGTWRAIKIAGAIMLILFILWCCHLVLKQRRDAEAALSVGVGHH